MSKIDFQYGGCGGYLGFFDPLNFSYFVFTRRPNAHHQCSVQLDYRGDVQNMNFQHFFPYKCIGPIAWGSKYDLAVKRSKVNVGS